MSDDYTASALLRCRSGTRPPSMVMIYRAPTDFALSPNDIGLFIRNWLGCKLRMSDDSDSPPIVIEYLGALPFGQVRLAVTGNDDSEGVGRALTDAIRKDYWTFE